MLRSFRRYMFLLSRKALLVKTESSALTHEILGQFLVLSFQGILETCSDLLTLSTIPSLTVICFSRPIKVPKIPEDTSLTKMSSYSTFKHTGFKLNTGAVIPALGLRTWPLTETLMLEDNVGAALKAGYKHIDIFELLVKRTSIIHFIASTPTEYSHALSAPAPAQAPAPVPAPSQSTMQLPGA